MAKSRKPVLYVGHGAVISNAGEAILQLATKLNAPIVNTLLGKGACAEDHPLHLGMLGMHGTAYANRAVEHCDLIVAIGARWDDRITGKLSEFCPDAVKIHIDIDVAEFNKVVRPDVSLAADARLADRGTAAAGGGARHDGLAQGHRRLAQAVSAALREEGWPARAVCGRPARQAGRTRLHHHDRRRPAPDVGGAVLPARRSTATGSRAVALGRWGLVFHRRLARPWPPASRSGPSSATAASR